LKRHRRHGHFKPQTFTAVTALTALCLGAALLLFPLWKALAVQLSDAFWVRLAAPASGSDQNAPSILSQRRDLLGLSWIAPVTTDRWFSSPRIYGPPQQTTLESEGSTRPGETEHLAQIAEQALPQSQDETPPLQTQTTTSREAEFGQNPTDTQSMAIDSHHSLTILPTEQRPGPSGKGAKSLSPVKVARFAAVNQRGGYEKLERHVVALKPGESAYFYPPAFANGSGPQWEQALQLAVIALGATPDRVDAPGHLTVEPIFSHRPLANAALKSSSTEMPSASGELSRDGTHSTALSGESSDTTSDFAVSHVPKVESLDLGGLVSSTRQPDALRLTWSPKSSGTLLVLGSRSGNAAAKHQESQAGLLVLTTDELAHPEPSLPLTRNHLLSRAGPTGIVERHEVWPAHPDEQENSRALLGETVGGFQPTLRPLVPFGRQNYRGTVRVDLVDINWTGPTQTVLTEAADARVTIQADPWGRIPEETTAQIASLVATGFMVHVHIWWKPKTLPFAQIGWEALSSNLLQGPLSERLASTLLGTPKTSEALRNREVFQRIDAFESSLLKLLPSKPQPTILVHIARQPNLLKREIVRLTEDVPPNYAPGYVAMLLGERWTSPDGTRTPSFPVGSPTTQGAVLSALLEGLSQNAPHQESSSSDPERSLSTNEGKRQGSDGEEKASHPAELVAALTGRPGSLFVFQRGWIYLPEGDEPGNSRPVFGVPLEDIYEARRGIYTHLNQSPIRLFSININTVDRAEVVVEWRSTYPVEACSASALGTNISQTTQDQDRTTEVRFTFPPDTTHAVATCIVDLSSKAAPLLDKQRLGEAEGASLQSELSLRASVSGRKMSPSDFVVGPYREIGDSLSLSKAGIDLDLNRQAQRLMKITASPSTEGDFANASTEEDTRIWLYMSPGNELPLAHPIKRSWGKSSQSPGQQSSNFAGQPQESRL
jgi:hypothetical protein